MFTFKEMKVAVFCMGVFKTTCTSQQRAIKYSNSA